jgi:UDP-glucose 4-epimerase
VVGISHPSDGSNSRRTPAAVHVAPLEWLTEHPDANLVINGGYGSGLSVLDVLEVVEVVDLEGIMEGCRAGNPARGSGDSRRLLETLERRATRADMDRIVADALAWERKLGASADR